MKKKISPQFFNLYTIQKAESITGNKKLDKIRFELKKTLDEEKPEIEHNLIFVRKDYGPRDPGISRASKKYMMMGLIEIEEELNKIKSYSLKDKGIMYLESLKKFYEKRYPNFQKTLDIADKSIDENKDLSGTQIEKKELTQETKKELWGKKL